MKYLLWIPAAAFICLIVKNWTLYFIDNPVMFVLFLIVAIAVYCIVQADKLKHS